MAGLGSQARPDGAPSDVPVISYTEQVLEEKEMEIRKYIEENYSKIQNVERELASLTMELKLTAGPKKSALEHMRKKIEVSSEKIKTLKQKEERARKVWEAANKLLNEEEENKKLLCEDLNRLVQESANAQYSRLEEMKRKLEALNPESIKGTHQPSNSLLEGRMPIIAQEGVGNNRLQPPELNGSEGATREIVKSNDTNKAALPSGQTHARENAQGGAESTNKSGNTVLGGRGRGRGRSMFVVQRPKGTTWTGSGFDVDDNSGIR